MAINSNNSNEEVMNSIKSYSGLSNFNIMAVNPTMDELHKMDIKVKQEPNYHLELNGEDYFKLVFWVKNEDLTTRLEILMQNKHRTSKTGKFQWLNATGQGTWSEDTPSYDWWQKPETSRKAFTGEETLINFVKAWANVAPGDNVYFDTIDKIVTGDVTELKQLVTALKDNKVRLLIGVKDGKYQQVYTRVFGRVKPQRDDLFVKALNDEYGAFNAEFNTDLQWGEFKPVLAVVTPDSDENEEWGVDSNNTEELPFSN
jgi:hypothetical protein|tara:strand:+ start:3241 stop:4014 length:774 start_codon:yes stop_codon:yes gene_type:complete